MYTRSLFKDYLTDHRLNTRAFVSQLRPDTSPLNPHHPHPDAIAPPAVSHQHCSKGCTTVVVELSGALRTMCKKYEALLTLVHLSRTFVPPVAQSQPLGFSFMYL